jgi:hypothetical protein
MWVKVVCRSVKDLKVQLFAGDFHSIFDKLDVKCCSVGIVVQMTMEPSWQHVSGASVSGRESLKKIWEGVIDFLTIRIS